jgi:crossover junction endodeoxyribonuclease RusA
MAAGLMAGEPIDGSLSCKIFLSPPDKRRRDVDNYSKGILDALENAQVFYDDCQIKHLEIFMLNPSKPGGARVELAEIQGVSQ